MQRTAQHCISSDLIVLSRLFFPTSPLLCFFSRAPLCPVPKPGHLSSAGRLAPCAPLQPSRRQLPLLPFVLLALPSPSCAGKEAALSQSPQRIAAALFSPHCALSLVPTATARKRTQRNKNKTKHFFRLFLPFLSLSLARPLWSPPARDPHCSTRSPPPSAHRL